MPDRDPSPIYVSGTSIRLPLASTAKELADAIREGRTALAPLSGLNVPPGIPNLGARFSPPRALDLTDSIQRTLGHHGTLLLEVLSELYPLVAAQNTSPERLGLFAALGMVDSRPEDLTKAAESLVPDENDAYGPFFKGAYRSIHPLWPLSMLGNMAVGYASMELNIRGDHSIFASGWDSGVRALLEGARSLRLDHCDEAFVAGSAPAIHDAALARLALQGGTSPRALGEGGAACLLTRQARNAVAILRGTATGFVGSQPCDLRLRETATHLRTCAEGMEPNTPHRCGIVIAQVQDHARALLDPWLDDSACVEVLELETRMGHLGPADALAATHVGIQILHDPALASHLRAEACPIDRGAAASPSQEFDHAWIVGHDHAGGVGTLLLETP